MNAQAPIIWNDDDTPVTCECNADDCRQHDAGVECGQPARHALVDPQGTLVYLCSTCKDPR